MVSASLIIRPQLIDTENLQNYDIDKRQCYFENEKKLFLFKNYTRSNCQLECLVNYTLLRCNCAHFSHPRPKNHKICDSVASQICFDNANNELMQLNMERSLSTSKTYDERGSLACGCLPSCTSLKYEGELSHDSILLFGKDENIE